ncbi:MAG: ATPase [Legionellales bacterium RIFCSPHIGHO2_12_FULL_37_14]|nr:MAG: ATPase [Legionellales bacterium RIFCSPHIGHO2_12_FULL_37_14]
MFTRTLTPHVQKLSQYFPVLLITGPRQVGKTTLLQQASMGKRHYVSLDDLEARSLAQQDPKGFLQHYSPPVTIDEIQYAPELFSYIKIYVDTHKNPGDFWLTGSQKFSLMKNIQESLAGRIAILDLLGLSQAEISGYANKLGPFLPTDNWIDKARKLRGTKISPILEIYQRIWNGSFPKIIQQPDFPRNEYFKSYIQTYIERDIRDLLSVQNILIFQRFIKALAARTAQLLNIADLARDVDISHQTAKAWLSVLQASGLIYLLYPYHNNLTKRLVKTPKVYFLETGLCTYLTQWSSPETLEAGALSGAILETYIFTEILKSYWHNAKDANFYFYRDTDQKEIDLLIESDGYLYPVEFKKTSTPSKLSFSAFNLLEKFHCPLGLGAVICLREHDISLTPKIIAIPVDYLL